MESRHPTGDHPSTSWPSNVKIITLEGVDKLLCVSKVIVFDTCINDFKTNVDNRNESFRFTTQKDVHNIAEAKEALCVMSLTFTFAGNTLNVSKTYYEMDINFQDDPSKWDAEKIK